MDRRKSAEIVLVHDWLTGMRGGEKCLESLCRQWPDAPLYTLLYHRGSISDTIARHSIYSTFLQRFPEAHRWYRWMLPLMPKAISTLRIPACRMVFSLSHCVAKSVQPPNNVPHVCYCFTPMRYAWHMKEAYFSKRGLKARLIDSILTKLREWDARTSANVSHFIAISQTIQQRIQQAYGRDSVVIYPPVDTGFYTPDPRTLREDFYLIVSALAPYKRIDLAIRTCEKLRKKLVIIGTGQKNQELRELAGPHTQFLGWQSDESIRQFLRRCKALIFPGEEDFGIVPVEANACGTPVIAFGAGGAAETILPPEHSAHPTGLWFAEQTEESLSEAILHFERNPTIFQTSDLRRQAMKFRKENFVTEVLRYTDSILNPKEVRRAA